MTLTATRSYGCAGAFLTERAVSAPTFPGPAIQRALLTGVPSRTYDVKLAQLTMRIEVTGEAPDWLSPTIQTMQHLSRLPANWSSYGSCRVEDRAIIGAAEVLRDVLESNSLAPTVAPTLQGGVQLEWHRNGADVEIELSPRGVVCDVYVYDRQTDRTWQPEQVTSEAFDRLRTTINRLGQP